LSITKEDYTGNQLNIRGYYYSNPEKDNDSKAYVFFSNGTFLWSYGDYDSLQMGLVNWPGTEIRKDDPVFWGAYNITGAQIIMEKCDIGKCRLTTEFMKGTVINDTTFILESYEHRKNGKPSTSRIIEETYNLYQTSNKPDSSNNVFD